MYILKCKGGEMLSIYIIKTFQPGTFRDIVHDKFYFSVRVFADAFQTGDSVHDVIFASVCALREELVGELVVLGQKASRVVPEVEATALTVRAHGVKKPVATDVLVAGEQHVISTTHTFLVFGRLLVVSRHDIHGVFVHFVGAVFQKLGTPFQSCFDSLLRVREAHLHHLRICFSQYAFGDLLHHLSSLPDPPVRQLYGRLQFRVQIVHHVVHSVPVFFRREFYRFVEKFGVVCQVVVVVAETAFWRTDLQHTTNKLKFNHYYLMVTTERPL